MSSFISATQIPSVTTTPTTQTAVAATATAKLTTTIAPPQFTSTPVVMRPVPPLLATSTAGQRTILSEQAVPNLGQVSNIAIAQRTPQPQPTVTHIRIQPQTTSSNLQRRGLALTVSNIIAV